MGAEKGEALGRREDANKEVMKWRGGREEIMKSRKKEDISVRPFTIALYYAVPPLFSLQLIYFLQRIMFLRLSVPCFSGFDMGREDYRTDGVEGL